MKLPSFRSRYEVRDRRPQFTLVEIAAHIKEDVKHVRAVVNSNSKQGRPPPEAGRCRRQHSKVQYHLEDFLKWWKEVHECKQLSNRSNSETCSPRSAIAAVRIGPSRSLSALSKTD